MQTILFDDPGSFRGISLGHKHLIDGKHSLGDTGSTLAAAWRRVELIIIQNQ